MKNILRSAFLAVAATAAVTSLVSPALGQATTDELAAAEEATAMAVEPGSVTARLVRSDTNLLTYSANATGWSRNGTVCINWVFKLGKNGGGGDGMVDFVEKDAGTECGVGSTSTPNMDRRVNLERWDAAFMEVRGFGPGGRDKDSKIEFLPNP